MLRWTFNRNLVEHTENFDFVPWYIIIISAENKLAVIFLRHIQLDGNFLTSSCFLYHKNRVSRLRPNAFSNIRKMGGQLACLVVLPAITLHCFYAFLSHMISHSTLFAFNWLSVDKKPNKRMTFCINSRALVLIETYQRGKWNFLIPISFLLPAIRLGVLTTR